MGNGVCGSLLCLTLSFGQEVSALHAGNDNQSTRMRTTAAAAAAADMAATTQCDRRRYQMCLMRRSSHDE